MTIDKILDVVAEHYWIAAARVRAGNRCRQATRARQVTDYFARVALGMSYAEIATQLGQRDHTSVIYSVRQVTLRLETDSRFAADLRVVRGKLALPAEPARLRVIQGGVA